MLNFRKKLLTRIGLGGGLIVLIFVGTLFFGGRISSEAKAIQDIKLDMARRNAAIQSLATLKNEANKAEGYMNTLKQFLPSQDNLILTFRKEIGALAKQDKLQSTFLFGDPALGSATEPGFIHFTISVTGPFNALITFLHDLETSRYVITMDSLEVTAVGKAWRLAGEGRVFSEGLPGKAPST